MKPEPKCIACGCTQSRACVTPAGPCYWVEDGRSGRYLCSGCAAAEYRKNGFRLDRPTQEMMLAKLTLNTAFGDAVSLIGAMQFALREGFTGPKADITRKWVENICRNISKTGQLRFILESGWDGTLDVGPAGEPGRIILPP